MIWTPHLKSIVMIDSEHTKILQVLSNILLQILSQMLLEVLQILLKIL